MLRSAIFMAVGAVCLALLAPELIPMLRSDAPQSTARAAAAPTVTLAKAEPSDAAPPPVNYGEVAISADSGGQYSTEVRINGQIVRMLVDTGATVVVVSYDTARRLGMQPLEADYTVRVRTANGSASAAPVTLRAVEVGSIYLGDVQALVAGPGVGPVNLLGMSFLRRLASVEQRSGQLVLRK